VFAIGREPLRILHVTPYSTDAWAYGGIPRLATTLTRELVRSGHEVTVCTTDACDASDRLSSRSVRRRYQAWPPTRTADGVVLRVFPNLSNRLAYDWQAFIPLGLDRYLRQHARSFDIAHLHACRNLPGAIAAGHLRQAGVPFVLAPNGTAPRIERRRLAKRAFDVVVGRRMLRDATCVLVVSRAERRQLLGQGVRPGAIWLIPNPVDLDEFSVPIPRGHFRQRFELGDRPIVLFLGKLTPRKRLNVLVHAFGQIGRSDARLVVAGNDMGSGDETRALVRSLGLEARTVFTGLLRGYERLGALVDADVLVYPSQDEIFGLVPLEALLSGTPVIVSDDCECGEVVRATGGGQVVSGGDAAAVAHAIDRVLDSPAGWRAAAAAAAPRVRAAYGGRAITSELADLYRAVVAAS
jgi:glycosyltransferase involved in cell wall biosynthesis